MMAATFRRPPRANGGFGAATVFRIAGPGRRPPHRSARGVVETRRSAQRDAEAGPAANRGPDPMGRRKSAEKGARGKNHRSCGASLAPRDAAALQNPPRSRAGRSATIDRVKNAELRREEEWNG